MLNKYSYPKQPGVPKEAQLLCTHTDTHAGKARKSIMLKTGRMPQKDTAGIWQYEQRDEEGEWIIQSPWFPLTKCCQGWLKPTALRLSSLICKQHELLSEWKANHAGSEVGEGRHGPSWHPEWVTFSFFAQFITKTTLESEQCFHTAISKEKEHA